MTRIGILSDTHLARPNEQFRTWVTQCFSGMDMIMHAGDLTGITVLDVFADKKMHAVHGNMCDYSAYSGLPAKKVIQVGPFLIGLTHGSFPASDIEERLRNEFGPIDCIVYGHTHQAVCHKVGPTLFINPGSFTTGLRHGRQGTYAVLEVDKALRGAIYTVGPIQ
jgi:putative phosphoesterase